MNVGFSQFDGFFNELGFGKPTKLVFNTKVKDMSPSYWDVSEDGYKGTFKTLGINPEDVKIKTKQDEFGECYLVLSGESELDGYKYSTSFDIPISMDVYNNIKTIQKRTQNGITILKLILDRPNKKEIKIEDF